MTKTEEYMKRADAALAAADGLRGQLDVPKPGMSPSTLRFEIAALLDIAQTNATLAVAARPIIIDDLTIKTPAEQARENIESARKKKRRVRIDGREISLEDQAEARIALHENSAFSHADRYDPNAQEEPVAAEPEPFKLPRKCGVVVRLYDNGRSRVFECVNFNPYEWDETGATGAYSHDYVRVLAEDPNSDAQILYGPSN